MFRKLVYRGRVSSMTEPDIKKAIRFINKCRYCVLGTVNANEGVHLSILTTQEKQELEEIWFISRTSTQKIDDIKAEPRCELLYTDNDNQINLTGKAEIVTEPIIKKALWNIWVEKYIPEGPESEEACLIKFVPDKINAIVV